MKSSLEAIAENIYYIIVDLSVCQFMMDTAYQGMLENFCKSIKTLSVLIKSSHEIVSFLKHVREKAENLDRICFFAIKDDDLKYFDDILNICSGVRNFNSTIQGSKVKDSLDTLLLHSESRNDSNFSDEAEHIRYGLENV